MLKDVKVELSDLYCYTTGTLCCAIVTCYNLIQSLKNEQDETLVELDKIKTNDLEKMQSENAFLVLESNVWDFCVVAHMDLNKIIEFMIAGLSKDLEHWKIPQNQPNIYFFISWWIRGNNPPPRCQALINNTLCLHEASDKKVSPYCDVLHSCRSATGVCMNQRLNGLNLCSEHCCNAVRNQQQDMPTCKSERIQGTEFCAKHICVGCLMSNTKPAKARNPNACVEHQCDAINCNELRASQIHRFCIKHVCLECAATGDIRNIPRKNESLCEYHKCSVPTCDLKRFNQNVHFCNYHICRLCATNGQTFKGVDLACPSSQLCAQHRCIHSNSCPKEKLNNLSPCCVDHSCKECIASKCNMINAAADKKPRNVCDMHKLCNFVNEKGKLCNTIAFKSSLYCGEHQERKAQPIVQSLSRKCFGTNSKGKPCGSTQSFFKIGDKTYCQAHKPKEALMEMSDSSDEEDNEPEVDNKLPEKNLDPVVPVQKSIENFKQMQCNHEKCTITTFCRIELSAWTCPIHEKRPQSPKSKEEEAVQPKPPIPIVAKQAKETKSVQIEKKDEAKIPPAPVNAKKDTNENKNEKNGELIINDLILYRFYLNPA